MANLKSEQIRSDFGIDISNDQPLPISEIIKRIENVLGKEHCYITKLWNKKVLCYKH